MKKGIAMEKSFGFKAGMTAALVSLATIGGLKAAAADDQVMAAIQAEIDRTMSRMQLPGSTKPYFVSCAIDQVKSTRAAATLGALTGADQGSDAGITVIVRVGDYKMDNSNFTAKQMWGGWSRLDWRTETPIDKDPAVLRRAIWWAVDRAYKDAVENLKRKRAVLENRSTPPVADDFAKAPVFTYSSDEAAQALPKLADAESQVRQLSRLLADHKMLRDSGVTANFSVHERWFVNSEGTRVHQIENDASVTAKASAQADDGVMIGDALAWVAKRHDQLPSLEMQKKAVQELGKRVEAMREAPLLEDFAGPVLFEREAAAELCARVLPEKFGSYRQPITEDEADVFEQNSSEDNKGALRRKIGRRVMSPLFSVVDDPTLQIFDGVPLVGACQVDIEGVKPERVELVKNGVLKTLLTTRTPDLKLPTSNGHAMALDQGWFGGTSAKPGITTLIVSYENGIEEALLRERLLQAIKDQDVEFGLVIRRMPQQSLSLETRGGWSGGESNADVIKEPLYVFAVSRDGKERLVRVVAFKGIGLREFKDVLAAGKKMYVANRGGGRDGRHSIVCPSILFEEGLAVKPERNIAKPPLLRSPMLPEAK